MLASTYRYKGTHSPEYNACYGLRLNSQRARDTMVLDTSLSQRDRLLLMLLLAARSINCCHPEVSRCRELELLSGNGPA